MKEGRESGGKGSGEVQRRSFIETIRGWWGKRRVRMRTRVSKAKQGNERVCGAVWYKSS